MPTYPITPLPEGLHEVVATGEYDERSTSWGQPMLIARCSHHVDILVGTPEVMQLLKPGNRVLVRVYRDGKGTKRAMLA